MQGLLSVKSKSGTAVDFEIGSKTFSFGIWLCVAMSSPGHQFTLVIWAMGKKIHPGLIQKARPYSEVRNQREE